MKRVYRDSGVLDADLRNLVCVSPPIGWSEIARFVGADVSTVRRRAADLGLKKPSADQSHFRIKDDGAFVRLVMSDPPLPWEEIAKMLKLHPRTCQNHARRLGISKIRFETKNKKAPVAHRR